MLKINCTPYNNQNKKEEFISVCDLFKLQVLTNPFAVAGSYKENSITYEELDFESTRVANFLNERGVKPETIVALALKNGLDLLVGMLGILKAGGAYLPVDPSYPEERIRSMLEDSNPHLCLTEEGLFSKFSSLFHNVVLINKISPMGKVYHEKKIDPSQLAYVVYTSGSTGLPKGIMMEHRALSYAAQTHQKLYLTQLVSLVSGSISFDASLLVMIHTLISGGRVCFPPSDVVLDPEQILSLIENEQINYTLCVPSFYSMLLDKSLILSSLERVDLGGENIPNNIPLLHTKIAPNAFLHNVYGPSEYAVGATFATIYDPFNRKTNKISIGKSFPGTQIYILNDKLEKVNVGVKGEIFISGPGLARGYLNKENLTKEKFIWISLPDCVPTRLYRTGDFGRFLLDGNIEFLGRIDHQIKIRGFRVELGEIEYSMCQYPGVNEALVISHEDEMGRKRLVAYFSAFTQENISENLRNYLLTSLPQFMVPSALIQIDHWPRTPNGKIDRIKVAKFSELLPSPNSFKKPLPGLEQKLFQIWQYVLGQEMFGVDDNFSDLGGDSLQVACMQTKIKEVLGIEISISDLYQYPTISKLAIYINNCNKKQSFPELKYRELSKNQKSAFQRFRRLSSGGLE